MIKSAIIYSRVSTKEQANENQVKQLTDYCLQNGYEIRGVYEEKVSGAATEKEVLDGIIASEPLADVLVIREVSRLSREEDISEAALKISKLVKKYTIDIAADRYSIPMGKVMPINDYILLIVKLYGAADERAKIVMRTQEARRRYKENKDNYASGGVPFGMEAVDNPNHVKGVNTKKIIVPGKDWETVLTTYRLKAEGLSYTQVARQVGITESLVRNIIRNKRIRENLPYGLAEAVDAASHRNSSAPNPTRHDNPYKGIIFNEDSDKPMIHQATSKGMRYYRDGYGSITDNDLNATVLEALTSFCKCFYIRKDDLEIENEEKIKELTTRIQALRDTFETKTKELSTLRKKALYGDDLGLYVEITKRIKTVNSELEKIAKEIEAYDRQIETIENMESEQAEVTPENLEYFVHKYVKEIRYYHTRHFTRTIRVVIKEEYIPRGYADYKDYEVYRSHSGAYIEPLPYSMYDLTPNRKLWGVIIEHPTEPK